MVAKGVISGSMKHWFVIHDLVTYDQHSDMIRCVIKKSGIPEPRHSKYKDIKKGDKVVYYAAGDYVITGIYEVISDMEHLIDDEYWAEAVIYKIKPVLTPPQGYYLDFKKLLLDSDLIFDMIPNKKKWGVYLYITCKEISEDDYSKIYSAISNKTFLRRKDIKDNRRVKI